MPANLPSLPGKVRSQGITPLARGAPVDHRNKVLSGSLFRHPAEENVVDEKPPFPAYLRRSVLKAGALAGVSTALMLKAGIAYALNAPSDQQTGTYRRGAKGSIMPLARIDLSKDAPAERIRVVSDAIYNAMAEVANVPVHDKFQVVTRHAADEIIYPKEGYLGLSYTPDLIIMQITWVGGRSVEVKKKFFRRVADEIHEKAQVRKEDIWINLVDSGPEDWSFGNGEMQYAPKG